jgi:glycosyltransferase involved in cell wall biosynthesis
VPSIVTVPIQLTDPSGAPALVAAPAITSATRVMHRAAKLGLGAAVLEGFAAAQTDIVGAMDGDLSHPPELLPMLFRTIGDGTAALLSTAAGRAGLARSRPRAALHLRALHRRSFARSGAQRVEIPPRHELVGRSPQLVIHVGEHAGEFVVLVARLPGLSQRTTMPSRRPALSPCAPSVRGSTIVSATFDSGAR